MKTYIVEIRLYSQNLTVEVIAPEFTSENSLFRLAIEQITEELGCASISNIIQL